MLSRTLTLVAAALLAAPAIARADEPASLPALERAGVRDIVVRHVPGLDRAARAEVRDDADVQLRSALPIVDTEVVTATPGGLADALGRLRDDPSVVYAEPDVPVRATTDDAQFGQQWALRNTGQVVLNSQGVPDADIDAPEAWSMGATGAGVTVAVVDTGVTTTHPDLAGQLAPNPGETGAGRESNGVDDDHDGLVDDWRGWDWVENDNDPSDANGHGTHVAGTIAAAQDTTGVTGVAPGARILPLRALDSGGGGTSSAVAAAFDYAGRLGIPIVNASLGANALSQLQRDAISAHPKTLYVVAAGNDDHNDDDSPTYPCALPQANIVCVGATDDTDTRAGFSNWGPLSVDLFAPGVSIVSDYLTGFVYMNGTSMAAPHVAGVLALMHEAAPTLGAVQLKQALLSAVDPIAPLAGLAVAGGRLNAASAIEGVRALTGQAPIVPFDPTPPDPGPLPDPVAAPATTTVATPPAIAAPRLTELAATPARATVCAPRAHGCRPRPAKLRYRSSTTATVTADVQRRVCTRTMCEYRTATRLQRTAVAGMNALTIGASGPTAHLAPGAYRVLLVARAGGAASAPVQRRLAVRRG